MFQRAILPASVLVITMVCSISAHAEPTSIVLHGGGNGDLVASELSTTGMFNSVSDFDIHSATPDLSYLQGYDSALVYTNSNPWNPSGLGDTLADYTDAGGHVALATYAFSPTWAVAGRIMADGYSPLEVNTTGNVSGNLDVIEPLDPLFDGVDLNSFTYYHNEYFADPVLDAGADLLATDGAGVNMIARNDAGNVIGLNLYPGRENSGELVGDDDFFRLFANAMQPQDIQVIPEPATWLLFGTAIWSATFAARRRRR